MLHLRKKEKLNNAVEALIHYHNDLESLQTSLVSWIARYFTCVSSFVFGTVIL